MQEETKLFPSRQKHLKHLRQIFPWRTSNPGCGPILLWWLTSYYHADISHFTRPRAQLCRKVCIIDASQAQRWSSHTKPSLSLEFLHYKIDFIRILKWTLLEPKIISPQSQASLQNKGEKKICWNCPFHFLICTYKKMFTKIENNQICGFSQKSCLPQCINQMMFHESGLKNKDVTVHKTCFTCGNSWQVSSFSFPQQPPSVCTALSRRNQDRSLKKALEMSGDWLNL